MQYIFLVVRICAFRIESVREGLEDGPIKKTTYERITKVLVPNNAILLEALNTGLRKVVKVVFLAFFLFRRRVWCGRPDSKWLCVGLCFFPPLLTLFSSSSLFQVAGHSAVDEYILEYQGESAYKIFMERKPHPWGFKCFFWCFSLTNSQRPVLYQVIPDLRIPIHSPSEIINKLVALIPQGATVSVTADSWFTSLQLMEAHPNVNFTFAISSAKLEPRSRSLEKTPRTTNTG